MTHKDAFALKFPKSGIPFCYRGGRIVRDQVGPDTVASVVDGKEQKVSLWYDPVARGEGDNVYEPNPYGFVKGVFDVPHSNLKSFKWYNNYVTAGDLNMIFYLASIGTILPQSGYLFPRSVAFSKKIGGYPWGAIVAGPDGKRYISTVPNNTADIGDEDGTWVRYVDQFWLNYEDAVFYLDGEWNSRNVVKVAVNGGRMAEVSYGTRKLYPIVVYRLHVVQSSSSGETYAWPQAYKYWVKQFPTQDVSSGGRNNEVYENPNGDRKVYNTEGKSAYLVQYTNGDDSGSVRFLRSGVSAGQNGVFSIVWGKSDNGESLNPFNHPDEGYRIVRTLSDKEIALDVGLFGYQDAARFYVRPEYDDEESPLCGTFNIGGSGSPKLNPGMISVVGESFTGDSEVVGIGDVTRYALESTVGAMSNANSDVSGKDLAAGFQGAKGMSTDTKMTDPICPIEYPFNRTIQVISTNYSPRDHRRLECGPCVCRRGATIYLDKQDGSDSGSYHTLGVLVRNVWTEVTTSKVQRVTDGISWWGYEASRIKEPTDRSMHDLLTEPYSDAILLGEGTYRLRMELQNCGGPVPYSNDLSKNYSINVNNNKMGVYVHGYGSNFNAQPRARLMLASVPFEHIPNAISSESLSYPRYMDK